MNYLNIDSFENRLNAWFRKKQDSVFVIEGPSQIGKTTFIQNYVRRHAVPNLYIDVKKHKDFLSNLLDDVNSVNDFFTTLCFVLNKPFVSSHTLIIFDGVEYCPKLRLFYKRFIEYENVNIVAISCGASGPLHYRDRLIPSSETVEYYKPLNFYEFLIAIGQKLIAEHLRSSIINKLPISQYLSSNLYRFYKIYNLVGGYPSSIQMYLTENDLTRCIKNNSLILEKQFEHAADLLDTEGRSLLFAIRDNLLSLITKKKYSSFDNYSAYRTKQIIQFLEEEHIFNIPTALDIGDFSKLSSGKRIYLSHQCFYYTLNDTLVKNSYFNSKVIEEVVLTDFYFNQKNSNKRLKFGIFRGGYYLGNDALCIGNNNVYFVEIRSNRLVTLYNYHLSTMSDGKVKPGFVLFNGDVFQYGDVIVLPCYCSCFINTLTEKEI